MNKFISTLKTLEPTIIIAPVLMFAVGLIVGQHTTIREASKPCNALTLHECVTDDQANGRLATDDQANGRLATDDQANGRLATDDQANGRLATDDPIFFPDAIPIIEPIDCEPKDKECLKQNVNAGKPAH